MTAGADEERAPASARSRSRRAGPVLLAALAVATYFVGLDSQHIPKNGDEYAYEHVTRMTAASGALLPLRSDRPELRNTKPPLLFWQGIASTSGGRAWTLVRLRYPSVLYTLLTAALVGAVALRLSGRPEKAWTALLCFLAFYSTYRYGRPFLTNAPETFWLFLPFAVLLLRPSAARSRVAVPLFLGLAIGLGLLYKSFALVVPVGIALAWWYLRLPVEPGESSPAEDAGKIVLALSTALAAFAAWPALDPDRAAVWRDFVLRENAGKFALPGGYLSRLLWGPSSLWSLALAYPANAGLLAFAVLALFVAAWRRRREQTAGERLLWVLAGVYLLAFAVPSQRSGRYLLPAMPALAILLALAWERIGRWAFFATLTAEALVLALVGLLALRVAAAAPAAAAGPILWAVFAVALVAIVAGLVSPALTRSIALGTVFLAYLALALLVRPLDGPAGQYDAVAQAGARGREVWVPYDFVAKEERYRFLLPGADVVGYEEHGPSGEGVAGHGPLAVVQVPLHGSACAGCTVLGRRLDLRGRQTTAELREIVAGRLSPALLVEEVLVRTPAAGPPADLAAAR